MHVDLVKPQLLHVRADLVAYRTLNDLLEAGDILVAGPVFLRPELLIAIFALERLVMLQMLMSSAGAFGKETHRTLAALEFLLLLGPKVGEKIFLDEIMWANLSITYVYVPMLGIDMHSENSIGGEVFPADLTRGGTFHGHLDASFFPGGPSSSPVSTVIVSEFAVRGHVSLQRVGVLENQVALRARAMIRTMNVLDMSLDKLDILA